MPPASGNIPECKMAVDICLNTRNFEFLPMRFTNHYSLNSLAS